MSPEAFADRFAACSRTLWCVAAAILGRPGLAEDVLQESAVIALGKLDTFDADTSFTAWMSQIVRYVALNNARRRRRRTALVMDPARLDESVAADPPPRGVTVTGGGRIEADRAGLDDDLLSALMQLEDDARTCLLLRVVMEMPYREIAQTLGIPEGTATSHVSRARRALGETLAGGPASRTTP